MYLYACISIDIYRPICLTIHQATYECMGISMYEGIKLPKVYRYQTTNRSITIYIHARVCSCENPDFFNTKSEGCALHTRAHTFTHTTALEKVSRLAVAVELAGREEHRHFMLPGYISAQIREESFAAAGLGCALWDAGVNIHLCVCVCAFE